MQQSIATGQFHVWWDECKVYGFGFAWYPARIKYGSYVGYPCSGFRPTPSVSWHQASREREQALVASVTPSS